MSLQFIYTLVCWTAKSLVPCPWVCWHGDSSCWKTSSYWGCSCLRWWRAGWPPRFLWWHWHKTKTSRFTITIKAFRHFHSKRLWDKILVTEEQVESQTFCSSDWKHWLGSRHWGIEPRTFQVKLGQSFSGKVANVCLGWSFPLGFFPCCSEWCNDVWLRGDINKVDLNPTEVSNGHKNPSRGNTWWCGGRT